MKPNTVVVGWPNNWRKREDDGTRVNIADYVVVNGWDDDDDDCENGDDDELGWAMLIMLL